RVGAALRRQERRDLRRGGALSPVPRSAWARARLRRADRRRDRGRGRGAAPRLTIDSPAKRRSARSAARSQERSEPWRLALGAAKPFWNSPGARLAQVLSPCDPPRPRSAL